MCNTFVVEYSRYPWRRQRQILPDDFSPPEPRALGIDEAALPVDQEAFMVL